MGCLDIRKKKQKTQGCLTVSYENRNKIKVNLNKVDSVLSVDTSHIISPLSIEFIRSDSPLKMNVLLLSPRGTVSTSRKQGGISVSTGLVCTASLGPSGEEMWWCNNMRVEWNGGIPTLWRS